MSHRPSSKGWLAVLKRPRVESGFTATRLSRVIGQYWHMLAIVLL
jgi:hypothetical protein